MESALRLVAHEFAIAIAIVRNDAITREGMTALLAQYDDFAVVASVADIGAAALREADPDIILVDAQHSDLDSRHLANALANSATRARIIVTGVSPDYPNLMALVRAGVGGFVIKDATFSDLAVAIRSVSNGAQVIPPALLETVSRTAMNGQPAGSMFDLLTPREREVTVHIANGKCNKEIAARIGISTYTVKSHVRNIMEKLGLHTRLQIAAKANQERRLLRHERLADSQSVAIRSASPIQRSRTAYDVSCATTSAHGRPGRNLCGSPPRRTSSSASK